MIKPSGLSDVLRVLNAMRAEDLREYRAALGDTPFGAAASMILKARPHCWTAFEGSRPAAVLAVHPRETSHIHGLTMVATDAWPAVAFSVTRFARRVMIPTLWKAGCRRAEARMIAGHPTAGVWLTALGAVQEATMPLSGINGETMHLFAFRAGDPSMVRCLAFAGQVVGERPELEETSHLRRYSKPPV